MDKYFKNYIDIVEDCHAKSRSYFFKKNITVINKEILSELVRIGKEEKESVRLSMHSSPEDDFHNMVIIQVKGHYVPPHVHMEKAESYHIIEGEMAVFLFDEQGKVIDKYILTDKNNFICRINKGIYHMMVPLSDYVIFHESTKGPFIRASEGVFVEWAPGRNEYEKAESFINSLLNIL